MRCLVVLLFLVSFAKGARAEDVVGQAAALVPQSEVQTPDCTQPVSEADEKRVQEIAALTARHQAELQAAAMTAVAALRIAHDGAIERIRAEDATALAVARTETETVRSTLMSLQEQELQRRDGLYRAELSRLQKEHGQQLGKLKEGTRELETTLQKTSRQLEIEQQIKADLVSRGKLNEADLKRATDQVRKAKGDVQSKERELKRVKERALRTILSLAWLIVFVAVFALCGIAFWSASRYNRRRAELEASLAVLLPKHFGDLIRRYALFVSISPMIAKGLIAWVVFAGGICAAMTLYLVCEAGGPWAFFGASLGSEESKAWAVVVVQSFVGGAGLLAAYSAADSKVCEYASLLHEIAGPVKLQSTDALSAIADVPPANDGRSQHTRR